VCEKSKSFVCRILLAKVIQNDLEFKIMSDSVGNVLGTVHEEESFTDKEDQIKNSESPMGIVIVEAPGDTIADKQYAE
jgi:hypothetical protein